LDERRRYLVFARPFAGDDHPPGMRYALPFFGT